MEEVQGIEKKRFGKNWGRRTWLFDRLIWTVMSYGVEIQGMKRKEKNGEIEGKVSKVSFWSR